MLKPGRVPKVKVLFLVLLFVLILAYSSVFEFSAAILEKGLLPGSEAAKVGSQTNYINTSTVQNVQVNSLKPKMKISILFFNQHSFSHACSENLVFHQDNT